MGVPGGVEWEARADDRVDLPLLPEGQQLGCALQHEAGLVLHQPTEIDALDTDVPPDEPGNARVLPESAGEADRDDLPERPDRLQRAREHVASDRIDHDV